MEIDIRKKECIKYYWDNRNREIVKTPTGLRKQKAMVFYNLFAYEMGEDYTFENLEAFEKGPVYRDVYNYIKTTSNYIESEVKDAKNINTKIMDLVTYLLDIQSDKELSELSHMDFWKVRFENEEDKSIRDTDISESDKLKIDRLIKYVEELKKRNYEKKYNGKNIILYLKEEISEFEYNKVAQDIDEDVNPVFLFKDEEGGLCID